MGLLKQPLNNERGSVLLMGLGMIVLATSMIVAVTLMSGKEASQRKYDRERAAVNEINSNVQTLLADARFCNDFFRQGYAGTTNSTIPFKEASLKSSSASAYANRSKEVMKEYTEKFSRYGYEVESISLSDMAIQAGVGQGNDNVKTFDVRVTVKKKGSGVSGGILDRVMFGKDGYNKANLIDHVSLAMTEKTGSCTLYKKALAAATSVAGMKALEDSCMSLGGIVDKNTFTCQLPKFENLNDHTADEIADGFTDGVLNFSKKKADTKFNFADALCEMEKNVLRKDRQNMSASYLANNNKNWTNFCKKPQWGGCFANNRYYRQGEIYNAPPKGMKAKAIKDFIKKRQNKTTERRFSRLYASPAQGSIADSLSISKINGLEDEQTQLSKYFGGGIAKALGLSGGFGITVGGISMTDLAIAAFTFGAIGVVITLLLGGCDKGRVYVTQVCTDGKLEDNSFRYQTQKRKRFRCKWKSAKYVGTADEVTIATKIKGQIGDGGSNGLGNPTTLPFLDAGSDSTVLTPEEIALRTAENEAAIKAINAATTLADLIEDIDSDEVGDAGEPEGGAGEVKLAYKAKEAALLNAHQAKISDVQARLAALTADPTVPIDPTVLSNLKKEAASLTSELLRYQNYQKTLDGVDRSSVSNQLASLSSISATLKTL